MGILPQRIFIYIALATVCFASIVGFITLNSTQGKVPPYIHEGRFTYTDANAYWQHYIQTKGPAAAYEEMVQEGYTLNPSLRHTLAHSFGEALYTSGGMPYLSYCGKGEFLYGCYHQFIGLTIREHGSASLGKLKDQCDTTSEQAIDCAHGIGHALLTEYGYTFADLTHALNDCHTLYTTQRERGICADGTFMEYNLLEITNLNDGRMVRPYSKEAAYEPCVAVNPEFQHECMFELPFWWFSSISTSTNTRKDTFAAMGALCRAMPSAHIDLMPTCFLGIGFAAAQYGKFDTTAIMSYCAAAAPSGRANTQCLTSAARRFYENDLPYKDVCGALGLVDAAKQYCELFVSLPREKEFLLPTP